MCGGRWGWITAEGIQHMFAAANKATTALQGDALGNSITRRRALAGFIYAMAALAPGYSRGQGQEMISGSGLRPSKNNRPEAVKCTYT